MLYPTELVVFGVGYHHAGMDTSDRKIMEAMFTCGDLPVLCRLTVYTLILAMLQE